VLNNYLPEIFGRSDTGHPADLSVMLSTEMQNLLNGIGLTQTFIISKKGIE
jgi:hypothetical protein